MEEFVRSMKRAVVIASSRVSLAVKKVVDASPALRIESLACAAYDRHLDCFPNEPGLHHFLDRYTGDNSSALRKDFDQPGFSEADQRLPHRLA